MARITDGSILDRNFIGFLSKYLLTYRVTHKSNNNREKLPQEYKVGFFKGGLFRYSRHPNFFCEISIWYIQFLFSFNSVGWNYCGLGAVLLNLLFLGSTTLTEKISTEKYPEYNIYR